MLSRVSNGTLDPSGCRCGPLRFRLLIRTGRCSSAPPYRASGAGLRVLRNMQPLLLLKITRTASLIQTLVLRPSPYDQWVGIFQIK